MDYFGVRRITPNFTAEFGSYYTPKKLITKYIIIDLLFLRVMSRRAINYKRLTSKGIQVVKRYTNE